MPVSYVVDNELDLFVIRPSGRITKREVTETVTGLSESARQGGTYRSLLVFEPATDLSNFDAKALSASCAAVKTIYRRRRLRRRAGAAVADASHDARLILPLWNAICEHELALKPHDLELDLRYTLFEEVEAALAWLDIPVDVGAAAVARAGKPG
jgi:hypothetical protein